MAVDKIVESLNKLSVLELVELKNARTREVPRELQSGHGRAFNRLVR